MNDLISRQAAIDALKQCTMHCVTPDSYHIDADDAMHRISVLPSAQSDNSNESEPPHSCKTCKYNVLHWYEEPCNSCTGDSWRPYGGDQKDDLISRQAAIDLAKDLIIPSESFHQYNQGVSNYCAELVKLQPAEPPYNPDEWCHDCKEYDQERHCCPRWNRVIRKMVDELELNRQKGGKNETD